MGFQMQNNLFNCTFLLVDFIKIVVFICKGAQAKLKCFL